MKGASSSSSSVVGRLSRAVSVYTLALIVAGGIRMLAIPFVVRAVTPRTYGTFSILSVAVWSLCGVGDLGLGVAALRLSPQTTSESERRSLFSTMLSARALILLVLTVSLMALSGPVARASTADAADARLLLMLAPFAWFEMLLEGLSDELRSRGQMRAVSVLVVLTAVLIQGLILVLVVAGGLALVGLVWAHVIGEALACVVALTLCWNFIRARPRMRDLRRLFAFSWPIGVMYVLSVLRILDRPLIRAISSLDAVGAYELAMRCVGPIGLFNIALVKVLEPFVYEHAVSEALPSKVDWGLRAYVSLFATVAMALSVLGPEIIGLMAPPSYGIAARALPALAFAAACEMIQRISGLGADLAQRTRVWALSSLVRVGIALPLMVMLLPRLGLAGAGLSWVAGTAFAALVLYRAARQLTGIVLPVVRAVAVVLGGAVIGTALSWEPAPLTIRLLALGAFAGLASWTLGVTPRTMLSIRTRSVG